MAGTRDHLVPFQILADQLLTLAAARSLTARAFTEAEHAQNHCQVGNIGLAIGVILTWLDATGGRTASPATGDAQGETHPYFRRIRPRRTRQPRGYWPGH